MLWCVDSLFGHQGTQPPRNPWQGNLRRPAHPQVSPPLYADKSKHIPGFGTSDKPGDRLTRYREAHITQPPPPCAARYHRRPEQLHPWNLQTPLSQPRQS